jgi:glutamate synthase (NADPH/NADH) small chain
MDYGQEEAAALNGRDPRRYAIMTKRFVGDDAGRVAGVETVDIVWEPPLNGNGRPALKEIAGTERFWPAQMVLLALGFLGPEQGLLDQVQVERDGRTNVKADYGRYSTNVEGVFAAGDARRGQSLVVWAINEGRGAARECDRYLMGESALP